MKREYWYDATRSMHIFRVVSGERSLQKAYTEDEYAALEDHHIEACYEYLEEKLEISIANLARR